MIDFPASPVAGQIFFASNGAVYQYNSTYTSWVQIASSVLQDGSFFATRPVSFNLATSLTTVALPTVVSGNLGGWYNSTTGVFTPPAGRYFLYASISGSNSGGGTFMQMALRKNGSVVTTSHSSPPSASNTGNVEVSATLDANGTDTFDIQAVGTATTATATNGVWFGAFPISQAAQIPGGGSSWRQIARTVVAAPQATLDFQNIPSDINDIELRFDLTPVNNDIACILQAFDAGGTIITSGYPWSNYANTNTAALNAALASSSSASAAYTSGIVLNYHTAGNSVGNGAGTGGIQGRVTCNNIRDASRSKKFLYQSSHLMPGGSYTLSTSGEGTRNAAGAISGVRLLFGSGNIAAGGSATLWGSP